MERFFDFTYKPEFRDLTYKYEDGLVKVNDGENETWIPLTNIEFMMMEKPVKKIKK